MNKIRKVVCSGLLLSAFCGWNANAANLVKDSKTDYVVVIGTNELYDGFAAGEFTEIMKKSTGVEFPCVKSGSPEAAKAAKRIFIGNSPEMRQEFGDIVKPLVSQESLVTEKGNSLAIIGGGNNGTPYGVYLFLENEIGYRCFGPRPRDERIVQHKNLVTSGKTLRRKIAFPLLRNAIMVFMYGNDSSLFNYRNCGGANHRYSKKNKMKGLIMDDCSELDFGHGFFLYVTNEHYKKYYKWDEVKDYFKTNPEYFSLNKDGKRTTHLQLCFSNKELRKEFTKRVLERGQQRGGNGFLMIGANDVPGSFCFCEPCLVLEKKYQTPAGAFFDYIPELCAAVAKELPNLKISTLAYRKKQTEIPPANVKRMPENWICDFAPVDDDQGQFLDGKNNLATLENLKKWNKITNNITYWFYSCISSAPFGIVERLSHDMKVMYENGVRGIGICGNGSPGMFPMQEYLTLRLALDPYQDPWPLVDDYNRHMYGAAAPEMNTYVKELEEVWREPKAPVGLYGPGSVIMAYTPERLIRWQQMFDSMEKKVADKPFEKLNLSIARWDIDQLSLDHWRRVMERYPKCEYTPDSIIARMRKTDLPKWIKKTRMQTAETSYLTSKALSKPIPERFAVMPEGKVTQIPLCGGRYGKKDPDAACGEAKTQPFQKDQMTKDGKKVGFNFYNQIVKRAHVYGKIDVSKCTPGKYELYLLKKTTIPRDGLLVFDNWVGVNIPMAMYYPEGDEFREFEIWASLKFVGPSFGIPTDDGLDRMFCDRIFLVDLSK